MGDKTIEKTKLKYKVGSLSGQQAIILKKDNPTLK